MIRIRSVAPSATFFALSALHLFSAAALASMPCGNAAPDLEYVDKFLEGTLEIAELSAAQLARFEQIFAPTVAQRAALAAIESTAGSVRYRGTSRELLLAPNGRYARYEKQDPMIDLFNEVRGVQGTNYCLGVLGRYSRDGPWIVMQQNSEGIRRQAVGGPMARLMLGMRMASMPAGSSFEQAIDCLAAEVSKARSVASLEDERSAGQSAAANAAARNSGEDDSKAESQRYLQVKVDGGELLLPEFLLPALAQSWDGCGPLQIEYGALWSAGLRPGTAQARSPGSQGFSLSQPLAQSTPEPLRRLEYRKFKRPFGAVCAGWSIGNSNALSGQSAR